MQNLEILFGEVAFCYYGRSQIIQQLSDHILAYVSPSTPLYSTFSARNSAVQKQQQIYTM